MLNLQHLTLELAEIYNEMFERKFEQIASNEGKIKKSTYDMLNKICLEAIKNFERLIESMISNKEALDNIENLRTIITAKFNVARNLSRYQSLDTKEKVSYLARALDSYRWIMKFIKDHVEPLGPLSNEMKQTFQSCEEMCELLPSKIDRINASQL